jgi:hypothetical protein
MSVTSRYITPDDYNLLEESLLVDEHHRETPASFFYEEDTVCSVFEDEDGIVLFVRAKTVGLVIVLDIQFLNNLDAKRNMRTMLSGFPGISEKAKENGFYGFMFASTVSLLRKFCCKRLGFTEYDEQLLVKVL